jgi:anti-sigma B factor antagonist
MKQEKLAYEVEKKKDYAVIQMIGDLDMHSLPAAKELINELMEGKTFKIIFNLEKVKYIDTSGLGFFIGTLRKLKDERGDMRLVNPNSYISGIFNLINLNKMIDIFDDLSDAEAGF